MEADFQSVWSRVNGASSQEAAETQLCRFLSSESEDLCIIRSMLRRTRDAVLHRQLCRVYTEKSRQVQRLRTALYLLTGKCECPAVPQNEPESPLTPAFRRLFERVSAAAEAYEAAASGAAHTALKALYSSLAASETRHAACLAACAERLLCLNGCPAPL